VRFTLNLSFLEPQNYLRAAPLAERLGFDSIGLSDSVFFPRDTSSAYPYNDDGSRNHFEDKPFLDAFSLIPAMGAVTSRIQFVPCVLKLPIRGPVIVAKLAMSTAVLTGNRFKIGVGTSPWPEDYEVCQVPWEGRGQRLDEQISIIRGLARGGYHEHHGQAYDFPQIKMSPVPTEPIPILVGGHARPALRRAATAGDGWIAPATGVDAARLAQMITFLRAERAGAGRGDDPFEVHASLDVVAGSDEAAVGEQVRALADLGVTDVRVAFRLRPYESDVEAQWMHLQQDATSFAGWIGRA
jgi:alkanesulfonate monooxygenase SsuD/methylene tetrahydromethanopterin reductase-like flavin-dependent oxidoreductase (luciferase family)